MAARPGGGRLRVPVCPLRGVLVPLGAHDRGAPQPGPARPRGRLRPSRLPDLAQPV